MQTARAVQSTRVLASLANNKLSYLHDFCVYERREKRKVMQKLQEGRDWSGIEYVYTRS